MKCGRGAWREYILGLIITLSVVLIPRLGAAVDLVVDAGNFTVTGDVTYDNEYIGQTGTGTLTHTNGTNTVTTALTLGRDGGADGSYILRNSDSRLLVGLDEMIGKMGTGIFTQEGGSHTVSGSLYLGYEMNAFSFPYQRGAGTFSLSGGSLQVDGNEYIGRSGGAGSFTHSAGTHGVNGSFYLGTGFQSLGEGVEQGTGDYTLRGTGQLSVAGDEFIGHNGGFGSFTQSGGTHIVDGTLNLGYLFLYDGSSGCGNFGTGFYTLSDGSLQVGGYEYIGRSGGSGTFTQSGGAHTVARDLVIGYDFDHAFFVYSWGAYSLSGGGLQVGGNEYIGRSGSFGSFTQSGGTHAVAGDLTLAADAGSTGSYALSGGSLQVGGNEYIGRSFGSGSFTQSGGTHAVTGSLTLAAVAGSTGSYALSGGSLQVGGDEFIGISGGVGTFNQSNGIHAVTGSLTLAADAGSTGSYALSGGSLTAGTVNLNANGTFSQTGGRLNVTSFNQNGGTVTAASSLENQGTFNYISGNFDGRLLNYGTVNFNADFTAGNGLANYSSTPLVINAGRNVTLNGAGLDNLAGLVVNGVLTGSGVNEITGILSGSGTITGNLVNSGRVNPGNSPGTLTISGNYTQTQTGSLAIEMASATSYDQLRITGSQAVLDGTLTPVLLGGYKPTSQLFPGVLSATNGFSGVFGAVDNGLYPTLHWTALYSANSVDLMVRRGYDDPTWGLTRNQHEVGRMLTLFGDSATGDLNTVLNSFDNLTSVSAIRDALQQVTPDKFASLSTLAFAGAAFQAHNLSNRFNALRFDTPGGGSGGLNFSSSRGEGLTMAFNAGGASNLFSDLDRAAAQNPGSHLSLSMEPGAALGWQNSTLNQTGFDFTIAGFTAAADCWVRDDLLIGLASGYNYTDASFYGSGGNVEGGTIPFNLYAAYFRGPFYLYGSAGYALNLFDVERDMSFGGLVRTAKSSTTGHQFNGYGETGYDLEIGNATLTPNLSLSYSRVWFDGFTEHGADALDLTIGDQNAESFQTGLGGRITLPFSACGVKVVPQIYASWQHELSNDSRILNAGLSQAGSNFTFRTDSPTRDFALAGIAYAVRPTRDLWCQINYNTEIGRDQYTVHTINAALWYGF